MRVSKGVGTVVSGYDTGPVAALGLTAGVAVRLVARTCGCRQPGKRADGHDGTECGQHSDGRAGSTGRPHAVLRLGRGRETTGVPRVGGK